MAFFFKPKRTMEELVAILDDDIDRLLSSAGVTNSEVDASNFEHSGRESPPPEASPRVQVEGRVAQIKLVLLGDTEKPPDLSQCQELAAALLRPRPARAPGGPLQPPVLSRLILELKAMPFETRKHTAQIFGNLMRRGQKQSSPPDSANPAAAAAAAADAANLEAGGSNPDAGLGFWAGVTAAALGQQQQGTEERAASVLPLPYRSLKALLLAGMSPSLEPETDGTAAAPNSASARASAGPEADENDGEAVAAAAAAAVAAESEKGRGSGGEGADLALAAPAVVVAASDVLAALVGGCGDPSVALNSGAMLRDAIRDVSVASAVFARPDKYVWPFFEKVPRGWVGGFLDSPNFDVSSDAFATLKDLLTRHKACGAVHAFLDQSYEKLFGEAEASVDANPATPATPPATPPPALALGGCSFASTESRAAAQGAFSTEALGSAACSGEGDGADKEGRLSGGGSSGVGHGKSGGSSSGSTSRGSSSSSGVVEGEAVTAEAQVRAARLVGLYGGLLGQGRNFFTRRQSLKLLAELLLDRANFSVMMRFISSKHNLRQMMHLLIDKSKNIQFEAFHVFKVFVANPRKPPEIVVDLCRNRQRLVSYLEPFHADRQDAQFIEEKALIIKELKGLQPPPAPPSALSAVPLTPPPAP